MQQTSKVLCALALLALVAGTQGQYARTTFWNNCGCDARIMVDGFCSTGTVREDWHGVRPDAQPVFHCTFNADGWWSMIACRSQVPWLSFRVQNQTIRICDFDKEPVAVRPPSDPETVSHKPSYRMKPW